MNFSENPCVFEIYKKYVIQYILVYICIIKFTRNRVSFFTIAEEIITQYRYNI